jgi:hypothetical protein
MRNQVKDFSQFVNENQAQNANGENFNSTKKSLNTLFKLGLISQREYRSHLRSIAQEFKHNLKTERAIVYLGGHGDFATIEFKGKEISVDGAESLRRTWQNILDTALDLGADEIYSYEDEEIITQADIDKLDDSPSEWE